MALPKLFQRIFWHNGTTPAINETNLNAMSQALDDIDDRLISLAGNVLEDVPAIQQYLSEADDLVDQMETLSQNPPYIGDNGDWYVWNTQTGAYVDSGVDASISITVGTVTKLAPSASPYVTNSGSQTDPIFNFGIPQGEKGEQGEGDMNKSTYDPSNTVATAGGIPAYVAGQIPAATSVTVDNTGTASSSGTRFQRIGVDGVYTAIDGTKYMEIANTSSTTYTFNNLDITASSAIDVYTDTWGDNPSAVTSTTGSCTVTFVAAQTRTVRIYIK